MKKNVFIYSLLFCFCSITACNKSNDEPKVEEIKREEDLRTLSDFEYTLNNLTAVDDYGRLTPVTDSKRDDKQVGVFYHVWHGYHNTGIFNITQLLENDPDSLFDPKGNSNSPKEAFHYWGEPLYGYYNSSDPWVITRHMELLTMAGVDYLIYDLTNTVIYTNAINAIFEVLLKYQQQGFNVPKVAFYTNSASGDTMRRAYNLFYKNDTYKSLWYSLDGKKPLIIGRSGELDVVEDSEILNFFQIKESQWPYDKADKRNGFPWMDWEYPQTNFKGIMSVSLAQHPGMRMSEGSETNHGRGFNYSTYQNEEETAREGTNVEGQWKTVFDNYDNVNNVFVTGWNEWIAQKLVDGADRVFFVDTYNEFYSRDMEMMKGGYGDNFFLQLSRNIRKFSFNEAKHYNYDKHTIDITNYDATQWENVKAKYVDFSGDALERNFISADKVSYLRDDSNRNDIVKTYVTHDANNLYIRVETKENITERKIMDKTWMNLMISTGKNVDNFNGFDFVVNRASNETNTSCVVERLKLDHICSEVGNAKISVNNNVIQYEIPLSLLGLSENNCSISFKVLDNIQVENDIQDYYVSGDCAPIGRLGYAYGY